MNDKITERQRAEDEHKEHLRFLESMDRVNRAIQSTSNLEQMMNEVLDVALSIFECDRAVLGRHRGRPDTTSFTLLAKRERPGFVLDIDPGIDIAADEDLSDARLRFDRFELDEADARLTCAGEPVPLAPKPFAVLCTLARTPQRLVTKNALLDAVWGHRFVTDSVLKSAVSTLRAALHDDAKHPRYIETASRRGYRFIAAALEVFAPAPAAVDASSAAPGHPALEALTALCRGDAALAAIIRTVAAALEPEPLALDSRSRATA